MSVPATTKIVPAVSVTVVEAAQWWVRVVPVVPVAPTLSNGPRPLVRWKEDGPLRTEEEVRAFWSKNPTAQLAVVLGPTTDGRHLGAIDTDLKNRKDGMHEPPAGFPGGYRHSTKSGGTHDLFLFKVAPPERVARRTIGVGGFVDVLLDGLLVVPPTRFDGAVEYRTVRDCPIPEFEAPGLALDQAAPWLAQAWKDHRPKAAVAGQPDDKEPVLEGSRRSTLLSRAGRLRDLGVGADAILTDLRDFNGRRCVPPLPDAEVEALARDVTRRYEPRHEPTTVPGTDGSSLFREVREMLERYYKFEQPWHSVLCALFVIQAHLARALPATFYLIVKGRYGGGKTSLLNVIGKLGGGLVFENVSVAALARELADGRLVCIDEYDVRRPVDVQPVLDSLVRQGYRRDAAPYTRYDATKHEVERIPVYGPKALT
ncbi:MAG: bifunctional DNA primase/polymerase, partial [Thermoplasmata archaeon]